MQWPVLGAALLTGFLGSAHCLGMCAGISGLFAVNAGVSGLRRQLPKALTYNLGRLISYGALGAIVAGFGDVIVRLAPDVAGTIRLLTGIVIILIGLQVAFDWRFLAPVEKAGAALWEKLAPAARHFLPVTSGWRALGLGLLWGWLPCGLVYSALLMAAASGGPLQGAATMLVFGAGTLPAMVLTGVGASQLSRLLQRRWTRRAMGAFIVILGLMTIALPVLQMGSSVAAHAKSV